MLGLFGKTRLFFKIIFYVKICFIFFLVIAYQNSTINNVLVQIHNGFYFPSNMSPILKQYRKHYFYMLYRFSTSLPRCVDLRPRPSSRYAVLVENIGDGQGYFMSALKLSVRLNWYLHNIRNQTDLILEMVGETSPQVTDVVVTSALRAGYDQVCHSHAIGGGYYNRFVIFNMSQYESILYVDNDIIPVNDVSDLIKNGTRELQSAGKYIMWARERRYNWSNAGVMLVLPNHDLFSRLMQLYKTQVITGNIKFIQTYSGIIGKVDEALLPVKDIKNQRDQAILNYVFHPQKNKSLVMSDKYNTLLYEHTDTSEKVLRYAHLIHLAHTKPWKEPWCYLRYNHGKICDLWFTTPTVMSDFFDSRLVY